MTPAQVAVLLGYAQSSPGSEPVEPLESVLPAFHALLAGAGAGRCKDCKHWGQDASGDYGKRELEEHPGMGTCDKILGGTGEPTDIYAIYCDGGLYSFTAPEFGCVLFERKEANTQKP